MLSWSTSLGAFSAFLGLSGVFFRCGWCIFRPLACRGRVLAVFWTVLAGIFEGLLILNLPLLCMLEGGGLGRFGLRFLCFWGWRGCASVDGGCAWGWSVLYCVRMVLRLLLAVLAVVFVSLWGMCVYCCIWLRRRASLQIGLLCLVRVGGRRRAWRLCWKLLRRSSFLHIGWVRPLCILF